MKAPARPKSFEQVYNRKARALFSALSARDQHVLIMVAMATMAGSPGKRAFYTAAQWRAKLDIDRRARAWKRGEKRGEKRDLDYTIEIGALTRQVAPKGWKPAAAPLRAASRRA